jgi:hypothetical protein
MPSSDSRPEATAESADWICAVAFCSVAQAVIVASLTWSRAASASTSLLTWLMLAFRIEAPSAPPA